MDFASLTLGVVVFSVALALESHRRLAQWRPQDATEIDLRYAAKRQRGRGWTNALLALIGGLALAAGLVGRGPVWLGLWAAIPLALTGTVLMACFDLLHTDRFLREKLPEIQRQTLRRSAEPSRASAAEAGVMAPRKSDGNRA